MDFEDFIEPYEEEAAGLDEQNRIDVMFRAVNDADKTGDISLRIQMRVHMMDLASEYRRDDVVVLTYPGLLRLLDEATERQDRNMILWYYKWALHFLPDFLPPTRAQIEAALQDFTEAYRKEGAPEYQVHLNQRNVYLSLGDIENGLRQQAILDSVTPDFHHDLADDEVRAIQWEGNFWCCARRWEKCIRTFKPLLDGTIKVNSMENINTWATILYPLWKLGRLEEADDYYAKAERALAHDDDDIAAAGEILLYAVLRKNSKDVIKLLKRWIPIAVAKEHQRYSLEFYACAVPALLLLKQEGKTSLPVQFGATPAPPQLPPSADGKFHLDELAAWCKDEAFKLALSYDTRNGNQYLMEWIADRVGVHESK